MRAILALLLGLCTIAISEDTDDSGEAFSWDSDDSDQTQSYDGLVVNVYNPDDGEPVITLGTDLDNHENTYCLTLLRVFEATGYDTSSSTSEDGDFTEVDGSSVDLSDANCTVSETSTTTFSITCNDIRDATLTFTFQFKSEDGDEGLEYTILLEDYDFIDDEAELVLAQSVKECSDEYAYSADSGSESEEDESEDTDESVDDDASTETPDRRLLSDDEEEDDDATDTDTSTEDEEEDTESDSLESEDGISSDDSDEYDVGYAQFIAKGQAYDRCNDGDTAINASLVLYAGEELHIVFPHFACNLYMDPYVGVDNSKLVSDSGAYGVYVVIASFIGLIGALIF